MKNLQVTASSSEAVQAMSVDNQAYINDDVGDVLDANNGHWVEFTAWEDSAWLSGADPSVPADLYNGHAMPEGASKVYWIKAGHKIAVKGGISISW